MNINIDRRQKEWACVSPGSAIGVRVPEGDIGFALRQFKKKVKTTKIIKEVFDRRNYTKPSIRRKEIKDAAKYRQRMETLDVNS